MLPLNHRLPGGKLRISPAANIPLGCQKVRHLTGRIVATYLSCVRPAGALVKGESMKAIVSSKYGPPEVLRLQEVDMPVMSADGVLVRVLAASVNPLDWLSMRGEPLLMRPMTGVQIGRA